MTTPSNEQFPILVARHLKMQVATRSELVDVSAEVGFPYWVTPGVEAACAVALRGFEVPVIHVKNIDPMSALRDAIAFVETFLTPPRDGATIYWPSGEPY